MEGKLSKAKKEVSDPAIRNGSLLVAFHQERDRWSHEIATVTRDGVRPVLVSIEGSPNDNWPDSPPLQELHLENQGGRNVALMVGRAGSTHWSLSVEPCLGTESILFDFAARFQETPRWMGSTYWHITEPSRSGRSIDEWIECRPIQGNPTCQVGWQDHAMRVAVDIKSIQLPGTVRWCYRFKIP